MGGVCRRRCTTGGRRGGGGGTRPHTHMFARQHTRRVGAVTHTHTRIHTRAPITSRPAPPPLRLPVFQRTSHPHPRLVSSRHPFPRSWLPTPPPTGSPPPPPGSPSPHTYTHTSLSPSVPHLLPPPHTHTSLSLPVTSPVALLPPPPHAHVFHSHSPPPTPRPPSAAAARRPSIASATRPVEGVLAPLYSNRRRYGPLSARQGLRGRVLAAASFKPVPSRERQPRPQHRVAHKGVRGRVLAAALRFNRSC